MDENIIVAIYIAHAAKQKMEGKTEVTLKEGMGIVGDRYAEGIGAWSNVGSKVRHVTIISGEEIRKVNREHNTKFAVWDTRRNIVVSDFDVYKLIDVIFYINDVEFRGDSICDPCDRPSNLSGKPGFKEAFAGGGGIRAEVRSSGLIKVGHRLTVPNS